MPFKMTIEKKIGPYTVSKVYPHDDVIWRKEPEKRERQMLADVRRSLSMTDTVWVTGGNGDIHISKDFADGEEVWNFNTIDGCRKISNEVVTALITYTDEAVQEQMVVRG